MEIHRISRRYRHEKAHFPFCHIGTADAVRLRQQGRDAAPGVRHWPDTHLLVDDVEITDPLDA